MPRSRIHVRLSYDRLYVGRFFSVTFQRTIRLPDDGRDYPLPPGFGSFPLRAIDRRSKKIPSEWRERGGFVLPMHRHEAMWLSFSGASWHPVAVRVDVGGVCALTGAVGAEGLSSDSQNYMVVPEQPWLDGIKVGDGIIRQFVGSPLGDGETVEARVTGNESRGGIRLTVVEPKPGAFPMTLPRGDGRFPEAMPCMVCESVSAMGLGAGGRMVQKIYPDPYGIDTWARTPESSVSVDVHLVDAREWRTITGEECTPSPISIETYTKLELPWFALADEQLGDIPPSSVLAGVEPVMLG